MKICIHCRGTNVTTRASVIDFGHGNSNRPVRLRLDQDPDAVLFKGRHFFETVTRLCLDCGYVALFCPSHAAIDRLIKQGT